METADESSKASIHVSELLLCDGTTIALPNGGVTAIVGGNNAGKSTLLRQMWNWLINETYVQPPANEHKILRKLDLTQTGTAEQFGQWVKNNSAYQARTAANPNVTEGYIRPGTSANPLHIFERTWERLNETNDGHIGPMHPYIVHYLPAGAGYNFETGRRSYPGTPPSHVLHYLEDQSSLRDSIDQMCYNVFGVNLTLDKLGQQVTLRVGRPPAHIEPPGYYDDEIPFREALDQLSPLNDQGDGMKAFIGKLLPIMTAAYHIILMDEPEAFLHPPQAAHLGRYLGKLAKETGVQIILATHDRNIIIGLLESECPLSVVRLNRRGDTTTANQLDPSEISAIWSDPVLRYSHVLDGLFHSRVVLVENERDATFYAAALDAAHEETPLPILPSDILLVPTHGKDGLAPVVKALKAIKIPTIASPDVDIMNDEAKMKKLVESLGHDWEDFAQEYRLITQKFRKTRTPLLVAQIASNVEDFFKKILEVDSRRKWDARLADEFRVLTRSDESPWAELKKHGINAFEKDVDLKASQFFDKMDSIGLVMVKVGELECFARGSGIDVRKGNEWLRAALEAGVHKGAEATKHARRLCTASPSIG